MTKISNRPLVPDSLRRKQVKGAKTLPQHKKQVKKPDSDDEDDDQESVSFFSFGEQEPVAKETSREDSQGRVHTLYMYSCSGMHVLRMLIRR